MRSVFAALLTIMIVIGVVATLDGLSDSRDGSGSVRALLGAVIAAIGFAGFYISAAIDEAARRIVPDVPKPPTGGQR